MTTCTHREPVLVFNAAEEPVRLNCACGREWRVIPLEWEIEIRPEPKVGG